MIVSGLVGLLITILIILLIAYVVIYAIKRLTPQFADPGQMIVGVVALILILIAVANYLGVYGGVNLYPG